MRIIAISGGAAVLWALIYATKCVRNPLAACRPCAGTGTRPERQLLRRGPRILRWIFKVPPRPCRRCDSTGRRIRLGRRAYDYVRNLQQAGTRSDDRPGVKS